MQKPIWIIGNGGHAKSLATVLWGLSQSLGDITHVVPVVSPVEIRNSEISESTALQSGSKKSVDVFFGFLGEDLDARKKKILEYLGTGFTISGFVARTAFVSPGVEADGSAQIFEGSYIGPDSKIERHCVINTGATVEHDCVIGEFSHISVRAVVLGSVFVGKQVFVGAGSILLPGVTIGDGATIGAGAVVTKDVAPNTKVVGSPARPISEAVKR
jgi:sugar O-acyltransferase (sialic acid O-acetyltransferase NeuD family)